MRLLHFYERKPLPACIFVTSQPQNNPGYGTNERGCSSANRDKKLDFSQLCAAITGFGTQESQVRILPRSRRQIRRIDGYGMTAYGAQSGRSPSAVRQTLACRTYFSI